MKALINELFIYVLFIYLWDSKEQTVYFVSLSAGIKPY